MRKSYRNIGKIARRVFDDNFQHRILAVWSPISLNQVLFSSLGRPTAVGNFRGDKKVSYHHFKKKL